MKVVFRPSSYHSPAAAAGLRRDTAARRGHRDRSTRELDDAYKFQELAALRTAHETLRADHEELLAAVRALQASRRRQLRERRMLLRRLWGPATGAATVITTTAMA